MKQSPLPSGCHSIKSAAGLLGLSEKKLFKKLREMGWLYTGTYKDDPYHNTPRRTARLAGWLVIHTKGYAAPYNKHIAIFYNQTLITQRGFKELQHRINYLPASDLVDKPTIVTLDDMRKIHKQHQTTTPEKAYEKAMKQIREWGLARH